MLWNPIQIPSCELLKDEYSCYAPKLAQMLINEESEDVLFGHLKNIRESMMQLPGDDPKDREIAKVLKTINIDTLISSS